MYVRTVCVCIHLFIHLYTLYVRMYMCSLGGGGVEVLECYPRWKLVYADLDSYQQLQTSLSKVIESAYKMNEMTRLLFVAF